MIHRRPTRLSKNSLLEKSSQKSPTTGSKIAKMLFGTQKTRRFSMFLSHFSKINFRKGTFSTVSTAGAGAGMESVWEQEKLQVSKMPQAAKRQSQRPVHYTCPGAVPGLSRCSYRTLW